MVTLSDRRTGRRRDVYLGNYGTDASRTKYDRVLADWLKDGRTLDMPADEARATLEPTKPLGGTVTALVVPYWLDPKHRHTDGAENLSKHGEQLKTAIKLVRSMFGKLSNSVYLLCQGFLGSLATRRAHEKIAPGWSGFRDGVLF
ncbi:MAG: hypothetical protein AAGA25_09865 [Planctomycetota bacterium]